MRIVDFLAATAGLEVDLNTDIINRYSLQAETDNLGIAGIFLIEVSKKLHLQDVYKRQVQEKRPSGGYRLHSGTVY